MSQCAPTIWLSLLKQWSIGSLTIPLQDYFNNYHGLTLLRQCYGHKVNPSSKRLHFRSHNAREVKAKHFDNRIWKLENYGQKCSLMIIFEDFSIQKTWEIFLRNSFKIFSFHILVSKCLAFTLRALCEWKCKAFLRKGWLCDHSIVSRVVKTW